MGRSARKLINYNFNLNKNLRLLINIYTRSLKKPNTDLIFLDTAK